MTRPLEGIKVVELGQALAGPLAGVILADMGADVIKVEKPDGGDDARLWGPPFLDGDSLSFHNNNRGKKSVTLDIKAAADVEKLKALVRDADVLIQNLRPGIVDDFGIGPEAMMAVNPRLIYCSIWAFGFAGPLKLAPGFDPLLQCYGAVVTLTGRPEDPRPDGAGMRGRFVAVRECGRVGPGAAERLQLHRQTAAASRRGERDPGAVPDLRDGGSADLHRRRQ
jgi:crotonobetainyl-CoA:carnitine CoA-transferase CaiB-like acyl-CoA transferase